MHNNTGQADIAVEDHGTVAVLEFNTPEALVWARASLSSESWQWMGPNRLAVEPRHVAPVVSIALNEGLSVEA